MKAPGNIVVSPVMEYHALVAEMLRAASRVKIATNIRRIPSLLIWLVQP